MATPGLPAADESAETLRVSDELTRRIREAIDAAGGWISFARYMGMALYEPGLGYYAAGRAKFGERGDFITAPEMSPLFGRTLGRQIGEVLGMTGGDLLELGAGSGRLAHDLLLALVESDRLPARYRILEVSAELRMRQRALLESLPPEIGRRVEWIERLPERIDGVVLANEVLDALPVHLVVWADEGIHERGVIWDRDGFGWSDRILSSGVLFEAAHRLAPGPQYVSEISLAAPALARTLAERLSQGMLLFIDYGFGEREYYHPQRSRGTLMCHYRHRAHDDPLRLLGLQDITSHVDFSAIARAAAASGANLLGYATQARFLINLGITDILSQTPAEDAQRYLPLAAHANKLLSPAEMGELFKVMALGRNLDLVPTGFIAGDRSALL